MRPKRKSQRKLGYDYSQPGYYAITICTQNRSCLFGVIDNGDMLLNEAGRMIQETWHGMPGHYAGLELDVFQIMPNHLHGIIVIRVGEGPCALPTAPCGQPNPGTKEGQTQRSVPTGSSLSSNVMRFCVDGQGSLAKSMSGFLPVALRVNREPISVGLLKKPQFFMKNLSPWTPPA